MQDKGLSFLFKGLVTEEEVWNWWRSITHQPCDIVNKIGFTEEEDKKSYELTEKHTPYGICFSVKVITPMKTKEGVILNLDFSKIESKTQSMALFLHEEHDEIGK